MLWARVASAPFLPIFLRLISRTPYPNAGVIFGSAETMNRVGKNVYEDIGIAKSALDSFLVGQIALSLAMCREGLEWAPIPLRYNFPNVNEFYAPFPEEAADIRVLHFMHVIEIDRTADFQTYEHVELLMARTDLSVLNAFLIERLRTVHYANVVPVWQQLSV